MIFAHCSSSNQNKFESIGLGSLQVDQAIEANEPCLGLEPNITVAKCEEFWIYGW
jgi:hypothetical protein